MRALLELLGLTTYSDLDLQKPCPVHLLLCLVAGLAYVVDLMPQRLIHRRPSDFHQNFQAGQKNFLSSLVPITLLHCPTTLGQPSASLQALWQLWHLPRPSAPYPHHPGPSGYMLAMPCMMQLSHLDGPHGQKKTRRIGTSLR